MRNFLLVLALVGAFQAGRLMPVRTAWSPYAQAPTVHAQTPPPEGGELDAFAGQVVYETLVQLEARAPAISEALRLEQAELAGLIQERLGPGVAQVQSQALATQDMLQRSQAVLDRSDSLLNRSEDLIDDSKDTLDDSRDMLDDSEDMLDDSREMLDESRKMLERSKALLQESESVSAEMQVLAGKLAEDIADLKTIIDGLPPVPR